jgi:hypothetical protein
MYKWIQDFIAFSLDAINNWAGYATGGVIVATIWFWSVLHEQPIRKKFAISLAVLFLYLGCFKAWRDQNANVIHAQDEQRKAENKLNELTIPNVTCRIDGFAIAPAGGNGSETLVTLSVAVHNTGAPSILDLWTAKLTFNVGDDNVVDLEGYGIPPPMPGGEVVQYFGKGKSNRRELAETDHLVSQTKSRPIVQGGGIAGWVIFVFPREEKQMRGMFTLSVHDVTGKLISCEKELVPGNSVPISLQDLMQSNKDFGKHQK